MTPQEIQEEAGILDKACRHIGAELAQLGLAALRAHTEQANAMVRKFDRLEAIQTDLLNQPSTESQIDR